MSDQSQSLGLDLKEVEEKQRLARIRVWVLNATQDAMRTLSVLREEGGEIVSIKVKFRGCSRCPMGDWEVDLIPQLAMFASSWNLGIQGVERTALASVMVARIERLKALLAEYEGTV